MAMLVYRSVLFILLQKMCVNFLREHRFGMFTLLIIGGLTSKLLTCTMDLVDVDPLMVLWILGCSPHDVTNNYVHDMFHHLLKGLFFSFPI